MSAEERAAFTATTANSAAVVPPATLNMIIDLVEYVPYAGGRRTFRHDFRFRRSPPQSLLRLATRRGVAEGTANDDEENEFDLLSLEGIEIKKHAVLSRKMKFKSIDAFAFGW